MEDGARKSGESVNRLGGRSAGSRAAGRVLGLVAIAALHLAPAESPLSYLCSFFLNILLYSPPVPPQCSTLTRAGLTSDLPANLPFFAFLASRTPVPLQWSTLMRRTWTTWCPGPPWSQSWATSTTERWAGAGLVAGAAAGADVRCWGVAGDCRAGRFIKLPAWLPVLPRPFSCLSLVASLHSTRISRVSPPCPPCCPLPHPLPTDLPVGLHPQD